MIATARDLQTAYNVLYAEFRNYIWSFEQVESLADLEVAVYQAFPDLDNVKRKFDILKREVSFTKAFEEDEILKDAFDDFEDALQDIETVYANLESYKEVVVV